jgi:hypothetical protein
MLKRQKLGRRLFMRIVQTFLLGFAFAAGITHADVFTIIVDRTAQTASANHEQDGSSFLLGGTGADENGFGCGGITPPNVCGLEFVRAEYVTQAPPHLSCDPVSPDCVPNDPTGLSPAICGGCVIAVDDPFGDVEAYFNFIATSHSIVDVTMVYALPGEVLSPPNVGAVVTDTGGIINVAQLDWGTQGVTDTIRVQFVPEPSAFMLLMIACGFFLMVLPRHRKTVSTEGSRANVTSRVART